MSSSQTTTTNKADNNGNEYRITGRLAECNNRYDTAIGSKQQVFVVQVQW